jgi:hypothetical protein
MEVLRLNLRREIFDEAGTNGSGHRFGIVAHGAGGEILPGGTPATAAVQQK